MTKKTTSKKASVGRPSVFSKEVAEIICDQLASGESLRKICLMDGMPSRSAVLAWLKKDPDFRAKCAHAREAQAEAALEDMIDIEDDLRAGKLLPDVARVLLSSKQWRACKQAPKKYGDKLELSGDPENPLKLLLSQLPTGSIKPVDEGEDE